MQGAAARRGHVGRGIPPAAVRQVNAHNALKAWAGGRGARVAARDGHPHNNKCIHSQRHARSGGPARRRSAQRLDSSTATHTWRGVPARRGPPGGRLDAQLSHQHSQNHLVCLDARAGAGPEPPRALLTPTWCYDLLETRSAPPPGRLLHLLPRPARTNTHKTISAGNGRGGGATSPRQGARGRRTPCAACWV